MATFLENSSPHVVQVGSQTPRYTLYPHPFLLSEKKETNKQKITKTNNNPPKKDPEPRKKHNQEFFA